MKPILLKIHNPMDVFGRIWYICIMYISALFIFVIGICTGGLYGYLYLQTPWEMVFSLVTGGFVGSAAGGILFSYLYFTAPGETLETTDLPPPKPPQKQQLKQIALKKPVGQESDKKRIKRLKKEINLLKKRSNH